MRKSKKVFKILNFTWFRGKMLTHLSATNKPKALQFEN